MVVLHGCLYVEAAPVLHNRDTYNVYDWVNNKISFKISANAIDQLLVLFNDTKQTSALIKFDTPTGYKAFSMEYETSELKSLILKLEEGGSRSLSLNLVLSMAEVQGLQVLLNKAKERVYGW